MPKWTTLKNKAILADACVTPRHLDTRHKKGVNVMYANGGAKWVPKEAFMYKGADFALIPEMASELSAFNATYNPYHLNDISQISGKPLANPTGLWIDYDKN